ncbi:hypothetical protein DQ04_00711000 [Trypanosoma grayi]|uniref:hypothetical protein n=1 Tax=Trypanosoma grayi TaxID=71804 RepID=UPI0004F48712|nr:hypothetical protein DQ04_00711000 [Trypanosoma grayi]KEG13922.1 hypothetical protein DQ04_00711000 [Trypanosoma grayi]
MAKSRRHDIVKLSKYKTSICSFYVSPSGCPFGDRCAFAHGLEELRCEAESVKSKEKWEKTGLDTRAVCDGVDTVRKETDTPLCCGDDVIGREARFSPTMMLTGACSDCTSCPIESKLTVAAMTASPTPRIDIVLKQTVSAAEVEGEKCVKSLTKTSKGKSTNQGRSTAKNAGTKTISGEGKNNCRRKHVSQLACGGNDDSNGSMSTMNVAEGLVQFTTIPQVAVLLPCTGPAQPLVPLVKPHTMSSHVMCLDGSGMRPAPGSVLTSFKPATVGNTGGMGSLSRVPGGPFAMCRATDLDIEGKDHIQHHNACNFMFASLRSSSVPPSPLQCPILPTPQNRDSMWSNMIGNGLLSTTPKHENGKVPGHHHHVRHGSLQLNFCCTLTSDPEGETTASKSDNEWCEAITKWLQNERETSEANSTGEEKKYEDIKDKVSLCSCMAYGSQGGDNTLQQMQAAPPDPSTEVLFSSSFTEDSAVRDNIGNASAADAENRVLWMCGDKEGIPKVNVAGMGDVGSDVYNCNREGETSSPEGSTPNYRQCTLHHLGKRQPIVVNHFLSSCASAGRKIFLSAERVANSNVKQRERVPTRRNSAKNPTTWDDVLEYCI